MGHHLAASAAPSADTHCVYDPHQVAAFDLQYEAMVAEPEAQLLRLAAALHVPATRAAAAWVARQLRMQAEAAAKAAPPPTVTAAAVASSPAATGLAWSRETALCSRHVQPLSTQPGAWTRAEVRATARSSAASLAAPPLL